MFAKGGICWSKTVALQYALPGCQDHHHHHHLVAQPVDDVEGVEEALRRLWVKEGGEVAVGVNLLQALLDLRICVKKEEDLPDSSRHDLGFGVQRQPVLTPAWNTTELSHEGEELGEVVLLEEQQHGDLVPAGEGGKLPSEITEPAHW